MLLLKASGFLRLVSIVHYIVEFGLKSIMKHNTLSLFVAINLTLLFLVGCGGGAGDDSGGDDDSVNSSNDVNGGFTGQLFMGSPNKGLILDLSTGKYKEIPGVDWSGANAEYHPSASHYANASKDGEEYIEVIKHCLSGEDPLSPYSDCIVLRNGNGDIVSSGKMAEDISRSTKLSNNKEYFAFFYNDLTDSSSNDELVIFDRNFQFISRSELGGRLARSFDWLNNGQIVYIHDQTIYITSPYSTEGAPIYTFSSEEGRPDYIAASPSDSRIAFTLVTDAYTHVLHGTTWVMNIDGTDLHQLAYDPDSSNQIFNYPAWSPNGDYILNFVGYMRSDVNNEGGVLAQLFAIPSSSRNVKLNSDGKDDIVRIRSYSSSNTLSYEFVADDYLFWIP
jgi:hypothetical protein